MSKPIDQLKKDDFEILSLNHDFTVDRVTTYYLRIGFMNTWNKKHAEQLKLQLQQAIEDSKKYSELIKALGKKCHSDLSASEIDDFVKQLPSKYYLQQQIKELQDELTSKNKVGNKNNDIIQRYSKENQSLKQKLEKIENQLRYQKELERLNK